MFSHRFRYIFIFLLAIYSYLNILFTEGDKLFSSEIPTSLLLFSIFLIVVFVWESNRLLFTLLDRYEDRMPYHVHVLIPFFLCSLLPVALIAILFGSLIPGIFGLETESLSTQIRLSMAFAFRINLFLHTLHAITYFNRKLRDSRLEASQLKTLHAESQFEALRNQVNPHFLFNSFSVLSGLVHKDAALASEFIQQLAKVYRYLLYNNDQKLVPLSTEIEFTEAYIFLLKIRFAESLIIRNQLSKTEQETYYIPHASIQLLLENAVKHNVVSKKFPLQIDIFTEKEFLIVKNNVQSKPQMEKAGGVGLTNIEQRYRHMTRQSVKVIKDSHYFIVMLPLFKQPDYESTHRRR